MGRGEQKVPVLTCEPVAPDGVRLVLDFHLEVSQAQGFLGNPDYVEDLFRPNSMVVVISAPELERGDFFLADSTSAVNVMLA